MEDRISDLRRDVNDIKMRQNQLETHFAVVKNDMVHLQEFRKETKSYFSKVIWLVIVTGLIPLIKDALTAV